MLYNETNQGKRSCWIDFMTLNFFPVVFICLNMISYEEFFRKSLQYTRKTIMLLFKQSLGN